MEELYPIWLHGLKSLIMYAYSSEPASTLGGISHPHNRTSNLGNQLNCQNFRQFELIQIIQLCNSDMSVVQFNKVKGIRKS